MDEDSNLGILVHNDTFLSWCGICFTFYSSRRLSLQYLGSLTWIHNLHLFLPFDSTSICHSPCACETNDDKFPNSHLLFPVPSTVLHPYSLKDSSDSSSISSLAYIRVLYEFYGPLRAKCFHVDLKIISHHDGKSTTPVNFIILISSFSALLLQPAVSAGSLLRCGFRWCQVPQQPLHPLPIAFT